MQSLPTKALRLPLSIKPDQALRSSNHDVRKRQVVYEVKPIVEKMADGSELHRVLIRTTEGNFTFRPDQHVAFPARPDGSTVIHEDDFPFLKDVFIGDVIPPYGGYVEDNKSDGLLVTDIQISYRYQGWIVSVQPVAGGPGHKQFVPHTPGFFYGDWWTDDLDSLEQKVLIDPKKSTVSGRYRNNVDLSQVVRFRIPNRRGAAKKGLPVFQAPKKDASGWEEWTYLDVSQPYNRHPHDPQRES